MWPPWPAWRPRSSPLTWPHHQPTCAGAPITWVAILALSVGAEHISFRIHRGWTSAAGTLPHIRGVPVPARPSRAHRHDRRRQFCGEPRLPVPKAIFNAAVVVIAIGAAGHLALGFGSPGLLAGEGGWWGPAIAVLASAMYYLVSVSTVSAGWARPGSVDLAPRPGQTGFPGSCRPRARVDRGNAGVGLDRCARLGARTDPARAARVPGQALARGFARLRSAAQGNGRLGTRRHHYARRRRPNRAVQSVGRADVSVFGQRMRSAGRWPTSCRRQRNPEAVDSRWMRWPCAPRRGVSDRGQSFRDRSHG